MKKNIDRRSFLRASALTGGGLMISINWLGAMKAAQLTEWDDVIADWTELNGYIQISADNKVQILAPNPEFGQNVLTSLAMMVAEELDVAWENVVVEQAPFNAAVYSARGARQFTGGSRTVAMWWSPLRQVGATAKAMLVAATAAEWGVSADQISAKNGMLSAGSKKASYGDMAAKAASVPIPAEVKLKDTSAFEIIGKDKKNVKGKEIVSGKPLFGLDYQVDGMLIAMIQHPPAFGMQMKSFDASQALKMPGIKDIFEIEVFPDGYEKGGFDTRTFNKLLAVVGTSTWEVMQARKKLRVQWEEAPERKEIINGWGGKSEEITPAGLPTSDEMYQKMAERNKQEATVLRKDGDPEAAFARASKILERTYTAPFLAHNCMEPMNFFAHVAGDKISMAGPLQAPEMAEATVSKRLGIPVENIEIHMTRMGGGFGRRAYAHYLVEAALISQKMQAPVKMMYTREDDMTYGIYRPMYTATYRAALDDKNQLIGFHVRGGGIPEHPIHANRFPAGAVENYLAEGWTIASNITIGAFRAPRSNFNAAAEQSFLDELAELMGKDPIDLRIDLLKKAKATPVGSRNDYDADRYIGVLEMVKEKSGWGKPEHASKKRGVAAYFCHASYAAHVVDMIERDGEPYVERVTTAMDCGVVVNPDAARNMVEGAVVDGIGNSFYGALTHNNGAAEQSNFDTYRIIRNYEAPQAIEVHFVQNDIAPTGLGEPPFPPVFGAVANALYQSTGKRHYHQPFLSGRDQI